MGWLTDDVEAVHVAFGTVLGPDGRPFRTRTGGTVRLMHLIDEAVDSARRTVAERADRVRGVVRGSARPRGVAMVRRLSVSPTAAYRVS